MGSVASFHLISERSTRWPLVLARLATDRRTLANVAGLRFARTLGTGRGSDTGPSIGPGRSAVFALWQDEEALDAFMADHSLPVRWRQAVEHWSVGLRPVHSSGSWGGEEIDVSPDRAVDADGPIAVLTRATIRPGATVPFLRAGRATAAQLDASAGLLAVIGIGERPIGRLGTFSVWCDRAAARAYATDDVAHRRAATEARRSGWFTEELFATFVPFRSEGTWGGVDPACQSR